MTLTDKFDDDPILIEKFNGQFPKEEGMHKVIQLVITYQGKRIPVAVFSEVIKERGDEDRITHADALKRYLEEKKIPYSVRYSEARVGLPIPEKYGEDREVHYLVIGAGHCLNNHTNMPDGKKEELMFINIKSVDYNVGLKRAHLVALQKRHTNWIISKAIID